MSKSITESLGWGPVGHAEEIQSSHMWHYYPGLVKMERAKDNPHPENPICQVDPRFPSDTLCYVPSNVEKMKAAVLEAGGHIRQTEQSQSRQRQNLSRSLG
ncbi:hypothetical protein ACFLXI_00645 [Chloroflexota bacterium]